MGSLGGGKAAAGISAFGLYREATDDLKRWSLISVR